MMQFLSFSLFLLLAVPAPPSKIPTHRKNQNLNKVGGKIHLKIKKNLQLSGKILIEKSPTSMPIKGKKQLKKVSSSKKKREISSQQQKNLKKKLSFENWRERGVVASKLNNGLLLWCRQRPYWKVTRVMFAVKGGSAYDPPELYGQTRFAAYFLRMLLNQPENPARSFKPTGAAQYDVHLGKEALKITANLFPSQLPLTLNHIAKVMKKDIRYSITPWIRNFLARSAGNYPPATLGELIDAYLFDGRAKGVFLRGRKKTFLTLQPFGLATAYKELFQPRNLRLLVMGPTSCSQVRRDVQSAFKRLVNVDKTYFEKKRRKHYLARMKKTSSRFWKKSLFLRNHAILLYRLPALQRQDFPKFLFTVFVAKKELERALKEHMSEQVRLTIVQQLYPQEGSLAFVVPSRAENATRLKKTLERAIGRLLMEPYSPALEARIELYRQQMLIDFREFHTSLRDFSQFLWQQFLFDAPFDFPVSLRPLLDKMTPEQFRKNIRHFLSESEIFSYKRTSSIQYMVTLMIMLFLLWFVLDLFVRRWRN